jgi:hypothetical protein
LAAEAPVVSRVKVPFGGSIFYIGRAPVPDTPRSSPKT